MGAEVIEADAKLIEKVRKWLAAHDASNYYASAILSQCPEDVSRAFVRCADEVSAQSAEIARLREALKPFADVVDDLDDDHTDDGKLWESPAAMGITAGDLRRARATLETNGGLK